MKKYLPFLSTAAGVGVVISFCLASSYADGKPDEWSRKFQEVSSYDFWTRQVGQMDGNGRATYRKPDAVHLQAFAGLRGKLNEAAKRFGVDPRAVAGAILAENSMNGSVTDSARNLLVQLKFSAGKIGGSYRSIGWGRVHADTAEAAEIYVAKLEKRTPKDINTISQELLSPEGSIFYAAEIIKQAQDIYVAAGFKDVPNRPEILATLYNLGKYQERADKSKADKTPPRMNYFGLFVDRYMSALEQAVGYSAKAQVGGQGADSEDVAVAAPAKAPEKAQEKPVEKVKEVAKAAVVPTITAYTLKSAIRVLNLPPVCADTSSAKSSGDVTVGVKVRIVAKTVDCDLKPWSLVRAPDGTTGWIESASFLNSADRVEVPVSCEAIGNTNCEKDVGAINPERFLKKVAQTNELIFRLFDEKKDCSSAKTAPKSEPALPDNDLYEMWDAYKKFAGGGNLPNTVQQALQSIDGFSDLDNTFNRCLKLGCSADKKAFIDATQTKITEPVAAKTIEALMKAFNVKLVDSSTLRDQFKTKVQACEPIVKALPKSAEYLKQMQATLESAPMSGDIANLRDGLDELEKTCRLLVTRHPPVAANAVTPPVCATCVVPKTCEPIPNPPLEGYYIRKDGAGVQYGSGGQYYGSSARGGFDMYVQVLHKYFMTSADALLANNVIYGQTMPSPSPGPSGVATAPVLPYCIDDSLLARGGNGGSYAISNPMVLVKAFEDSNDHDDEFKGFLSSKFPQQVLLHKSNFVEDDCKHDISQAQDAIAELAKSPCVQNIYVSDLFMFDYINGAGTPVTYRPLKNSNNFVVELKTKNTCEGKKP